MSRTDAAAAVVQVLVVDDDADLRRLLAMYLSREGFQVTTVGTAAEMQRALRQSPPDIIVLDVLLPGDDGLTAVRKLRASDDTPVVMISGKGDTIDRVVGLELGADDYLSKPFELRELLARLRTVLRRRRPPGAAQTARPAIFRTADLTIDIRAQRVTRADGSQVSLTAAEQRILQALFDNSGRVLSRDQLLEALSGREWDPLDRSIDVHIAHLRRKLGDDPRQPRLIKTVRGAGYVLEMHATAR